MIYLYCKKERKDFLQVSKKIKKERESDIMANKKVTKRDMFEEIKKVALELERTDIVEFAENELNLLEKKKNSSKKVDTEKLEKDNALKGAILEVLKGYENGLTVDEIRKADTLIGEESNQKVTYLLGVLVKENLVEREPKGRKKLYKVIIAE